MSRRDKDKGILPSRWLPIALLVLWLPFVGVPPLLDEESYLDIARQIADHPFRPYDWWRRWQPWGAERVADAFLYAHPPGHLWWVGAWRGLVGEGVLLRVLCTAPWALLLGFSVGKLAEGTCRRPNTAAFLFAASPVVILALHAGLMPDLGTAALGTAAVAMWREALGKHHTLDQERAAVAGVLLALACAYKYPALLLLPVLVLHAIRRGQLRAAWPTWAAFAGIWGALELLLWIQYGRFHLLEVLAWAPEIARGSLGGRTLGTLVRLALVVSPLALLAASRWRRAGLVWLPLATVAVLAVVGLDELGPVSAPLLIACAAGGGVLFLRGLAGLLPRLDSHKKRRKDRDDPVLLGAWAVAVILGVVLGHNYAGGRYLLPAAAPLALLLGRTAENTPGGKLTARVAGLVWVTLGMALGLSQARQAKAVDLTAQRASTHAETGRYTGEWTFRWRMDREGWEAWVPGEPLADGTVLAVPVHSGPAPVPTERLTLVAEEVSTDTLGLRLVDLEEGIGYHAETLGPLPFGWVRAPLERVRVYRVGGDADRED